MPNPPFIDMLDAVQEQFVTETVALMQAIYGETLDMDGGTYGDVKYTRGQRIGEVVDYSQRGVMDALRMVCEAYSAPWYERKVRQFIEDIGTSPLERGV